MALPGFTIGALDQWVTLQTTATVAIDLATLTAAGGLATAITTAPHTFTSGDEVAIAGVLEPEYAGRVIVTILDAVTFAYTVPLAIPATATGSITATYIGDGAGGGREAWHDVAVIAAEVRTLGGAERMQAQSLASTVAYRLRIWDRPDVRADMRILWSGHTLNILDVLLTAGIPKFLYLDCVEAD